jgi:hypothetical protein
MGGESNQVEKSRKIPLNILLENEVENRATQQLTLRNHGVVESDR